MIKILDKIRSWIKELNRIYKELDSYDRVYFHGKLFSAIIFILSLLLIGCIILVFFILD